MNVYHNRCGPFEIEVSEPSPMWVKITHDGHIKATDLYDLRHLVERAIAAAEARDPNVRGGK